MSKVIRISEIYFHPSAKLCYSPRRYSGSVIEKILDFYELENQNKKTNEKTNAASGQLLNKTHAEKDKKDPRFRMPRQRGTVVEIEGKMLSADSLADLYEQVLKFLSQNKLLGRIDPHLPIATSRQRYLIAKKPVHPNGNEFFRPVTNS